MSGTCAVLRSFQEHFEVRRLMIKLKPRLEKVFLGIASNSHELINDENYVSVIACHSIALFLFYLYFVGVLNNIFHQIDHNKHYKGHRRVMFLASLNSM